jgi:hypothetical protein
LTTALPNYYPVNAVPHRRCSRVPIFLLHACKSAGIWVVARKMISYNGGA